MIFLILSIIGLFLLLLGICLRHEVKNAVDDGIDVRRACETSLARANREKQENIQVIALMSISIFVVVLTLVVSHFLNQ